MNENFNELRHLSDGVCKQQRKRVMPGRKAEHHSFFISEKLYPHLREIDETANRRLEPLMPELMKHSGVTESLKASDPMKWMGLMNALSEMRKELSTDEVELRELTDSTLNKLAAMSDEDFAKMVLYPDFDE